jgi:hypothetical protein
MFPKIIKAEIFRNKIIEYIQKEWLLLANPTPEQRHHNMLVVKK